MRLEILLSVAVAAFMGTVLVWLSIIVVDTDHWYSSSAVSSNASGSHAQVLPAARNVAAVTGGAQ